MATMHTARTLAALVLAATMPIGPPVQAATPASVKIENFTFEPGTIDVPAGTAVTFTNADDIPHSVVGTDGSFHSKALDTGDSFTFVFRTRGTFGYFCGLHPHMQGRVVVTP